MKRYLLFTWAAYDAGACGWNGFHSDYDTAGEARIDAETKSSSYSERCEVVDLETGTVVWEGDRSGSRPNDPLGPIKWK